MPTQRKAPKATAAMNRLSVHELFEKGNEIGGALKKRHYNLDKSFIGTDEANLMLLKAAHKGMTQQAIAAYLAARARRCKNA